MKYADYIAMLILSDNIRLKSINIYSHSQIMLNTMNAARSVLDL